MFWNFGLCQKNIKKIFKLMARYNIMDFVNINEAIKNKGNVKVRGWVYRERKQKDLVSYYKRFIQYNTDCC